MLRNAIRHITRSAGYRVAAFPASDLNVDDAWSKQIVNHRGPMSCSISSSEQPASARRKDRVFVAVERDGAAVRRQIALQCFEVAEGALWLDEAQFHQRAGGVHR